MSAAPALKFAPMMDSSAADRLQQGSDPFASLRRGGRYVPLYSGLARVLGADAALVLQQLAYLCHQSKEAGASHLRQIEHTREQFINELGITRWRLVTALKLLADLGLVSEAGFWKYHRPYYTISSLRIEALARLLDKGSARKDGLKRQLDVAAEEMREALRRFESGE
jgi:hypothetical protein